MGEAPEGLSLDRINGDLGYSPENCRWADPVVQAFNRHTTHRIEYGGEMISLADFARRENLYYPTLAKVYRKSGHDLATAVEVAKKHKPR